MKKKLFFIGSEGLLSLFKLELLEIDSIQLRRRLIIMFPAELGMLVRVSERAS